MELGLTPLRIWNKTKEKGGEEGKEKKRQGVPPLLPSPLPGRLHAKKKRVRERGGKKKRGQGKCCNNILLLPRGPAQGRKGGGGGRKKGKKEGEGPLNFRFSQ